MGTKITIEESVEQLNKIVGSLVVEMRQGFKDVREHFDRQIDGLARAVKIGFDAVDERFNEVDERFNQVDKRFEAMDERFEAVDERFDAMDQRFDAMDERFERVEKRLDKIEFGSRDLVPRITALEDKMHIVGTKLGLQS